MTSSVPAADRTPPAADINFDEGITPDQRRYVEQSIATMIERSSQASAGARARETERSKLLKAAAAPLARLIEQDLDAAKAIDALRAKFRSDAEAEVGSDGQGQNLAGPVSFDVRAGTEIFPIPYHFDWRWFDSGGGGFPHTSVDRNNGVVNIDVRASAIDGSTGIRAHAGFGVILNTDREVAAIGRALRQTHDKFGVAGGPGGGHAISEGGAELTVFENGNFVTSATEKRWRKRVSNGELDSFDSGGFGTGAPIEVVWPMRRGFEYTLNVGVWVYAEYDDGLFGDSWARSVIDAKLIFLSLVR
jgi:hypothetical protein